MPGLGLMTQREYGKKLRLSDGIIEKLEEQVQYMKANFETENGMDDD